MIRAGSSRWIGQKTKAMDNRQIRQEITRLLLGTGREGIRETVDYLLSSSFFSARCHSHHRFAGGLARHSLEACRWGLAHSGGIPAESVILATLLHDTCTAWSPRSRGIGGHGKRSVHILEDVCGLALTDEEREAIALHMHKEALWKGDNPLAGLVWKADKVSAAGLIPLCERKTA